MNLEKYIQDYDDSDFMYLTLYQPILDENRSDFRTRLKSLILETFRNNKEFCNDSDKHNLLLDKILLREAKLQDLHEGICVVMKFDPNQIKPKSKYEGSLKLLEVITLPRKVERKGFLGRVYDLDQLSWTKRSQVRALVFAVSEKKVKLFKYLDDQMRLIKIFESEFGILDEKENFEKYSPMGAHQEKGVYHGLGEDKVARRKNKYVNTLLNKVRTYVKDKVDFASADHLVVFFDESIREEAEKFATKFKDLDTFEILLENIDAKSENELKKFTLKRIKEEEGNKLEKLKSDMQEEHNKFTKKWDEIIEASRMKKIEALFVSPTSKKEGFRKDELLYISRQENSKKIENLRPWLVRDVLEGGGKIWSEQKVEDKLNAEILAKLRF